MKRFQKRTGLRIDGIARPGGETERRLNEMIQPIARLAGHESSSERKTETGISYRRSTGTGETPESPSPATQLADAASPAAGTWRNPSAWALEKAGRTVADTIERAADLALPEGQNPTAKPDEPKYEWEEKPSISGHRGNLEFDTDGPVRIGLRSATQGLDGLSFDVRWFELDEQGKVVSQIWPKASFWTGDPSKTIRGGRAGFDTGEKIDLVPPFEGRTGKYRVIITVPPGRTYHGNSAGVDMEIYATKGRTIQSIK